MKPTLWWRARRAVRRPIVRRPHLLRPRMEMLEDRTVPSASLIAVGADAGGGPRVTVLDRSTGAVVRDFFAYSPGFTGGVRVALADVTGDGTADIITAAGPGGGPHVKVFNGATGALVRQFFAYSSGFSGGVNVAAADVNGDGTPDIITSPGAGGGPHVKVFDGKTGAVIEQFMAYAPTFTGGVTVAAADANNDGKADIVTGAGPGGGPHVKVFSGADLSVLKSFFAYAPAFTGGVNVAAADLNADGKADVITGAGPGTIGPEVKVFSGADGSVLTDFLAYAKSLTGGVRVGAFSLDSTGRPAIVTVPGAGGGGDVRVFTAPGGVPAKVFSTFAGTFGGGSFVAGFGLNAALGQLSDGTLGNFFQALSASDTTVLTLHLDPLNINLLGLQVQSSPIDVTVSVQTGSGELLGNLLTVVSNLVNLQGVNTALNNVLGSVVGLLNSAGLAVNGLTDVTGPLSTAPAATTPVLNLFVAPVHLNLLGAKVDTSPITLTITANSGDGLVLGNVLADLANLFNPPLPDTLTLDVINGKLTDLLNELNAALPGIGSAPVSAPPAPAGSERVLSLVVPPIDVNLLGLVLQTAQIQVNADAQTGDALLLGNVLTTLLNTLGATPDNLTTLSNNLNAILAKVVGVLNASTLTLAAGAVEGLSQVLQTLALPNLVNTSGTPQSSPVLDLAIASPDGTTPPVDVNLLGLRITTSNIHAQLVAQTGDGQVLGNLVYNVAHLLDPGGSLNLLTILNELGV
ncbi:MAG TPA: VCBS repeat-containing protein [Gemmataceae bacterium]|jgi:hypothetical protein